MLAGAKAGRAVEVDQLDLDATLSNPSASHAREDTAVDNMPLPLDLRGYGVGVSDERHWWEHLDEMTSEERAELAASLTAELDEDDPMAAAVRRLLGVADDASPG